MDNPGRERFVSSVVRSNFDMHRACFLPDFCFLGNLFLVHPIYYKQVLFDLCRFNWI